MENQTIRINKVLRELNISLERAVDFLKKKNILIESNPNTKISEEVYELLINEFAFPKKQRYPQLKEIEELLGKKLTENYDKESDLENHQFRLDINNKIIEINLSKSNLSNISFINLLNDLEVLILNSNNISDINCLKNLRNLRILNLNRNNISDISHLSELNNLQRLELNYNNKDININHLAKLVNLKILSLNGVNIEDISPLNGLKYLEILSLNDNRIEDLNFSKELINLYSLQLNKNNIKDVSGIEVLKKLIILDLESNSLFDIGNLKQLKNLQILKLKNNILTYINDIKNLTQLIDLDLSRNFLDNINELTKLKKLKYLNLNFNGIYELTPLKEIINSLDILHIYETPITVTEGWKIEEHDNHLELIKDYFSRNESEQLEYKLPVKVLLLGNHAAGKSTLLDYLLNDSAEKLPIKHDKSTHIIRIEQYSKKSASRTLPEIIYYDFGGQDYYHGIYKSFLTNDALNLLLWNVQNNNNQIRTDSKGLLTRDFDREYWLYQLKYYFDKNINSNDEKNPILLIQTHADKEDSFRDSFKEKCIDFNIENEFYISLLENEVIESLTYKTGLTYLEANINEEIKKKIKIIKRPKWYGDFINYILRPGTANSTSLNDILKEYKREQQEGENSEDIVEFLKNDLDQLHRQGLILYYKDDLPDVAWLNPTKSTKYIHDTILSKSGITNNGKVKKTDFDKIKDKDLITMLTLQKVIFFDDVEQNYIIPNFLPLSQYDHNNYEILTFGLNSPDFVLKYSKFLPFGIVNQLICHFGRNPDSKHFWRDQLIFTLDSKAKVLIKFDFNNLEIIVHFQFIDSDSKIQELIKRYIFNCLMAVYWDRNLISFDVYKSMNDWSFDSRFNFEDIINNKIDSKEINNENISKNENLFEISLFLEQFNCFPDDMFISIDNKRFINCLDFIESVNLKEYTVKSYSLKTQEKEYIINDDVKVVKIRSLDFDSVKETPIHQYQVFTNEKINKMKKIFISYSNEDHYYKDLMIKNLKPLTQFQLLTPWSCEDMTSGNWHNQIQDELSKADIVIFMMSLNFITSDYILREEVYKTFEEIKTNPEKKVICVLVKNFPWILFNKFKGLTNLNEAQFEELQDASTLSQLVNTQFIPYYIENKGDKENEKRYLQPINKWKFEEDAYVEIMRNITANL